MQDAQTSQVDGYGGMKVKLLFVASIFPHFSLFLISFIFSTAESDGEGKCLKSNPSEALQKSKRE